MALCHIRLTALDKTRQTTKPKNKEAEVFSAFVEGTSKESVDTDRWESWGPVMSPLEQLGLVGPWSVRGWVGDSESW